jgi:hypothetical protein
MNSRMTHQCNKMLKYNIKMDSQGYMKWGVWTGLIWLRIFEDTSYIEYANLGKQSAVCSVGLV